MATTDTLIDMVRDVYDGTTHALKVEPATGGPTTVTGTVTVVQPDGTQLHATIDSSVLPTGAATASKQDTGNTSLASIDGKLSDTVNGLKVDGSGVTQPVSGTVTANQGGSWAVTANAGTNLNTSALALDTSVNGLIVAQASTTSGESGPLVQGATTTSAPVYTTGKTNPLSLTTSGALRTDSSASTQPVSGTVTANQGGTWTVQPGNTANTTAWKVDGSAVTQPISGTVTANQGGSWTVTANAGTNLNTSALALDTSVNGILLSQGSTTASQTGPIVQGAVTTAAPTYTTGKTDPLSLTTTGALRVDNSAVTQPVSGTVTANQGGTWTVQPGNTANTTAWKVDGSAVTQPVSGTVTANAGTNLNTSALALDTSVNGLLVAQGSTTSGQSGTLAVAAVTTAAPSYTTAKTSPLSLTTAGALRTDASASTQPVSGTVAATQSGTWTVQPGNTANTTAWKVDGSAVTQPVSGTVTANAGTNLNTSALALDTSVNGVLLAQASTTSGQTGPIVQGAVTTAAPTYTTAKTNPLSLTTAGALRVDNSAVTQPVSGTITANQGGTWTVQPGNTANTTAWKVDGSAVTQPVSGTVTANAGTNLNTSALALDASVNGLLVAQGSTTSGQSGTLAVGATTTAAPTYTTAKTNPLSLTTAGALRVDNSAVTQPVSGTVTANQGGTWTVQPGNTANTTAWKVDGSAVTQPVSGTVTANAGTNLNTSSLALDASVTGLHYAQGSTTSGQNGALMQGAVTTAAPSYTTAKTNPLSLDTSGNLRVSVTNASVTVAQTVFGTVTTGSKSSIGTSAVQVNSSSIAASNSITVRADTANTGVVYIGPSTVTANTTAGTDGIPLTAGESITVPLNNINIVYAIGSATGQKVFYMVI